ncbi:MAG: hypothetical protein JXR12_05855 [Neptunomonas phycophila]|uniref:SPFH domain-containing protein n=1 Tax=Neptunomonas phycophila TaxID=1572645 RepID=UPI003B8AD31F
MDQEIREAKGWLKSNGKKLIGGAIAVILGLGSFEYIESGEFVRIQSPFGGHTWETTPGLTLKWPLISRVDDYNQYVTIAITDDDIEGASVQTLPHRIGFADTYEGTIEATFRFGLSPSDITLEKMHQAVKTKENLNSTTLANYQKDLLNYTANQFRAEDFMQGGQNEYKSRLYDQAANGQYVTKRVKEVVQREIGDSGLERDDAGKDKVKTGDAFVYSVKIMEDEKTGLPLRNVSKIADFGITVEQISIIGFNPENDLKQFMTNKKTRVRERAEIVEKQENEREKAITAQLEGDRKRIEARNTQLMEKDREIIQAEKRVELEQKEAELQVIAKQKEADIAEKNKEIEKFNAEAAKFKAQTVREMGIAEADVQLAMYKAYDKDVKMMEIQLERDKVLYNALQNFKIDMPDNLILGQGGQGASSLDTFTTLGVVKQLSEQSNK